MVHDDLLGAPPDFSVCWKDNDFPAQQAQVEQAILDSWGNPNHSSVAFTGWDDCGSADIKVYTQHSGVSATHHKWGWNIFGSYRYLDHIDLTIGTEPYNRFTAVAIHEFGHALGFSHEHNRPENDNDHFCNGVNQGTDPDTLLTPYDHGSIMSATGYCTFNRGLSLWDTDGLRRSYGFPRARTWSNHWCAKAAGSELHVGDFDGDGMDDLLCHGDDGTIRIDYGFTHGHFNGTDWWREAQWCTKATGSRLYIGDFNGDDHDDLFCHCDDGTFLFDFADGQGRFGQTDYEYPASWCKNADSHLFIGDFDGDGSDDLLCHADSGKHWIDYAHNGFAGTDWKVDRGWCTRAAGSTMYVGKFNGDRTDDLLCLGNRGKLWVDYAWNGMLRGTDWKRDARWCKASSAELFVGDFNGDGRDDIMCHHWNDGYKFIDFVDPKYLFQGDDWRGPFGRWCNGSSNEIFIGNFNGDAQSDLLCLTADGTLHLQYPTPFVDTSADSRYGPPLGYVGTTGTFMSLSLEQVFNAGSYGATLGKGTQLKYGPFHADAGHFKATLRVRAGDADLYVKVGSAPTTTSYDCRPYKGSLVSEACTLPVLDNTEVYVTVRGYSADRSDFSLRAAYKPAK